jgi:hypothetical protein
VNLGQISKVKSGMPTRPVFGEGRSGMGKNPSQVPLIYWGNEDGMSDFISTSQTYVCTIKFTIFYTA